MKIKKIGQLIDAVSTHWSWPIWSSIFSAAIAIAVLQIGRHVGGREFVHLTVVVFDHPILKVFSAAAICVWVVNLVHEIRCRRKERQ